MASWTNLLLIAFLVWFSWLVWVEKSLETSTRASWMSLKVILLSLLVYLFCPFSQPSIAETKAERTALSGEPPYSSQEELW